MKILCGSTSALKEALVQQHSVVAYATCFLLTLEINVETFIFSNQFFIQIDNKIKISNKLYIKTQGKDTPR